MVTEPNIFLLFHSLLFSSFPFSFFFLPPPFLPSFLPFPLPNVFRLLVGEAVVFIHYFDLVQAATGLRAFHLTLTISMWGGQGESICIFTWKTLQEVKYHGHIFRRQHCRGSFHSGKPFKIASLKNVSTPLWQIYMTMKDKYRISSYQTLSAINN